MKKSLLFVTSKWCDAIPKNSFSNESRNHFATFRQDVPDYNFNTLFLDECSIIYKSKIDEVLIEYCDKYKPDIIIYSLIADSIYNPSKETFLYLKKTGVLQFMLWSDTGPDWGGWGSGTIRHLSDSIDAFFSTDYATSWIYDASPSVSNHLHLWTPLDKDIFYKPLSDDERDIDISFLGSIDKYKDRMAFAALMNDLSKKTALNILISGGERTNNLTPEEYGSLMRRSKIGVNFSLSQTGVFHQSKGRVLEYTAAGALLLESANPSTSCFFEPNKDYIEFTTFKDMLEKMEFYLTNPKERAIIADNGNKKFLEKYSSKKVWERFFNIVSHVKAGKVLTKFQRI